MNPEDRPKTYMSNCICGIIEPTSFSKESFSKHKKKCFQNKGDYILQRVSYKKIDHPFYVYKDACLGCGLEGYTIGCHELH